MVDMSCPYVIFDGQAYCEVRMGGYCKYDNCKECSLYLDAESQEAASFSRGGDSDLEREAFFNGE